MSIQFSTFKNVIKEFLKLDEEIRSLSKAKIDRMRIRDKLSKEIMIYYKHNNIHSLDLNFDGAKQQLELVESTRHPSVNQKFLRKALVKYCNNDKIVDSMIDHILEERDQNSSVSFKLKRITTTKKKPQIDAMNLIKENDKNLIEERFAKLAEYAIMKDSIEPFKKEKPKEPPKEIQKEPEPIKDPVEAFNEVDTDEEETEEEIDETNIPIESNYDSYEETDDNEDNDDEDIDIDNIPEEETGYDEEPPDMEKEYPIENTIRNVINNKLDIEPEKQNNKQSQKEKGAIPILKPVNQSEQINPQNVLKELEVKALESWKKLDTLSSKYIYLSKWLVLQKEKIKLYSSKAQIEHNTFIQMNEKVKKYEKELENEQYDNEIVRLKMYIIKYIEVRFSLKS